MNKKKIIIALIAAVIVIVGVVLGITLLGNDDSNAYLTLDTYTVTEDHYIYYCTKGFDAAYIETGIGDNTIWEQEIDGTKTEKWIKNYANEQAVRYLVVNKLFNELGLEFTREEIYAINDEVNNKWLYSGIGNVYEGFGVDQLVYNDIYTTEKRVEKLTEYFSEELSQSITEDEIEAYLVENYASVIYFAMSYTDGDSESTLEDYENYCRQVENGKSLEALVKELEASDNEFIVTSAASGNGRTDTVITGTNSGFPLDYVTALFEAENGTIIPYDDTAGNIYVLSQRTDILADDYYLEHYRSEITNILLTDRYEEKIQEETESYDVDIHRAAKSFDVEALYND
ncbi:MAG: hypothetical protein E7456_07130 [Ruminococcaceae bacterium]|nr:hypothetical protein [Oscillospiraceae bacterium]